MGQSTLGTRKILINSGTDFPLTFWDNTNTVVLPAAATKMRIEGFGTFELPMIHNVRGNRGAVGTVHTIRLNNTNVTVNAPVPPNTIVRVEFDIITTNEDAEFVSYFGQNGTKLVFQVIMQTGETYQNFLAKIYNIINQAALYAYARPVLTVTAGGLVLDPTTGLAVTATSLDISTVANHLRIRKFLVTADDRNPSYFVSVTSPILVSSPFEGRNNYDMLKSQFIVENRPHYHIDYFMTPLRNVLYASISWKMLAFRTDGLAGGVSPDQVIDADTKFEIFINELACVDGTATSYLGQIATFLDLATILSTATPARYKAPVWGDSTETPVVVPVATFYA